MKKYVLLMILGFFIILSSCSQSEEDKIHEYLDKKTSYDILTVFKDGVLNIEVPTIDEAGTWNEDGQMDVNLETIILLEAVKRYPRYELDLFKEVNLRFITKETNKIVAEVNAKSNTFMETDWREIDNHEVPQIVEHYKFNGEMK